MTLEHKDGDRLQARLKASSEAVVNKQGGYEDGGMGKMVDAKIGVNLQHRSRAYKVCREEPFLLVCLSLCESTMMP